VLQREEERIPKRLGAHLVDRSWHLHVSVLRDHKYLLGGEWEPGIWIYCRDPEGMFESARDHVTFDECRLTAGELQRVYGFIDRWLARRVEYVARKELRKARRARRPRTTAATEDANSPIRA
jgi:hypothetical protein